MEKLSVIWSDGSQQLSLKFGADKDLRQIIDQLRSMGLKVANFTVRGTTVYCASDKNTLDQLTQDK